MEGCEWSLAGQQVIELPGDQVAPGRQLDRVPGESRPGDNCLEVGHHAAHRPADTEAVPLEGEEPCHADVIFEDRNENVRSNGSCEGRELRPEERALECSVRELELRPRVEEVRR